MKGLGCMLVFGVELEIAGRTGEEVGHHVLPCYSQGVEDSFFYLLRISGFWLLRLEERGSILH